MKINNYPGKQFRSTIFEFFKNCEFNDDGICTKKHHNVGVNGYSILNHCGKCYMKTLN